MATPKAPIAKESSLQRFLVYLILVGSLLVTVVISPWNYDPVSVPKMTLLALVAIFALILHLVISHHSDGLNTFNWILLVFVGLLVLNLFVNNYAFSERVFGVNGRNTGFVTYISFAILAFLLSRNFKFTDAGKVLISLFFCNLVVMCYYVAQRVGIDFINITEYYSRPSSTLGNPNYISGFLGFTILIPLLAYLINRRKTFLLIGLFTIPSNLFVIWDSQSIQGIFAAAFSMFVLIGILLKSIKRLFWSYLLLSIGMGLIALAGIIGKGPLATILNSTTLLSRFDYWRTAISMTTSNPLFGVGLDGYGDYYRKYRDDVAFDRFGESSTSDTPHNVPLDFFASGGFILGIYFLILLFFVYLKTVRILFSSVSPDFRVLGLFTLLNGYLIQSLVSPNQIGVGIWLWILMGALAGSLVDIHEMGTYKLGAPKLNKSLRIGTKILSIALLLMVIPFILVAQKNDQQFLSAARSTDGTKILQVIETEPYDTKRFLLTQKAFSDSQLHQYSLRVSRLGVAHNPNSYLLWKSIYENPTTPAEEKIRARAEMKRLEPRFTEILSTG